jgi:hypothetical protein
MQMSQETLGKDQELVTIEGLQFKRYQMDWIERMTEMDGWTIKEWMEDVISKVVLAHVAPRDYPTIPDERLREDIMEQRKRWKAELSQR